MAFKDEHNSGIKLADYHVSGSRYSFPNWNNLFTRLTGKTIGNESLYFTPVTVGILAARHRLYASTISTAIGNYGPTIDAQIGNLPDASSHTLALGVIAAQNSIIDLCELISDTSPFVAQAIVVIDSEDERDIGKFKDEIVKRVHIANSVDLRIATHPLNNNFAAQRNRVQEMATTDWVIQLDTDERLTNPTKALLPHIVAAACLQKWSVVGVARRNLVDGALTDLYPDEQYRLLPADRRFTRAVHEHPVLNSGECSFPFLGAEILHFIQSDRLRVRESRYEGIMTGAAREHDTALLRSPFSSNFELPSL